MNAFMKRKSVLFPLIKGIIACVLGGIYAQIQFCWNHLFPAVDFFVLLLVVFVIVHWRDKKTHKPTIYARFIYGVLIAILYSVSNTFFYVMRML